ncbi:MAG: S8 family serine peptidase [Oleiphilus sp.]
MRRQLKSAIPNHRHLGKVCHTLSLLCCILLTACGGSSASSSDNSPVTISGNIAVQRDSDIDLDLNSPTPLNDSPDDPQIIANPTTLGGYLSGYSGQYAISGTFNTDANDYFSVSLVEGQAIQLSLFQADTELDNVDVTLSLQDENDNLVSTKSFTGFSSDAIIVPDDGIYLLSLSASDQSDPLLYTLSLSQSLSNDNLSSSDFQTLSTDFIPGEVLVKFKSVPDQALRKNSRQQHSTSSHAISHSADRSENVDHLDASFGTLQLKDTIPAIGYRYGFQTESMKKVFQFTALAESHESEPLAVLEAKIQTLELIKQLAQRSDIEFAEPNYLHHAAVTTDDPRRADQWNLDMLSANAVWQVATGEGVIVAVLDTGIDASHVDLSQNSLSDGYDFISSESLAGDGNGQDSDPRDEGSSFHGSHVAGIIAAQANNAQGIAGLAYDAKILPLRVLGIQDAGSSSDIAQAILYAAGLSNSSGRLPVQPADIINMSFGSENLSKTVEDAISKAQQAGLILIAAAGNAATDKPFYPAALEQVIGVGSVSSDFERSSFSNFGPNVALVAPGGTGSASASFDGFQDAILSTVQADNYTEYLGTSMAAPHVSAVAALMKQLKPSLSLLEFVSALEAGVLTQAIQPEVIDTRNFFGKGLIDTVKAVNWAAGSDIVPAILSIYPTQFGFIGAKTQTDLYLTNSGDGDVSIVDISVSDDWLAVTEKNVADSGLGVYLIEVSLLQAPVEQGSITIQFRVNNGELQQHVLSVFVSRSTQTDSTVGVVFVSLFKEEDIANNLFDPFVTVGGQLSDGVYRYCFENIPKGRYLLTASTDNDRDQLPFDSGEASGTYPLQSRPDYIEVKGDNLSELNFDIQYPSFVTGSDADIQTSGLSKRLVYPSSVNTGSQHYTQGQFVVSQSTCAN